MRSIGRDVIGRVACGRIRMRDVGEENVIRIACLSNITIGSVAIVSGSENGFLDSCLRRYPPVIDPK